MTLEIILGISLGLSTAADTATTRIALNRCQGYCHEANPILRPFADNTAALTAVNGLLTVGVIKWSHALKVRRNKAWWVPLVVGTGGRFIAAKHNANLIGRLPEAQ